MQQSVPDGLAEVATIAFDLLLTIALTGAGISAELHSMQMLNTDVMVALWFGYMGLVALYAGVVLFGRGRVAPHLQRRLPDGT